MSWLAFACMCCLVAFSCGHEAVVNLTDANFDEYLKSPVVMVKYYAPWCGHCKELAPEYEKAAKTLKDEGKDYILAELDATMNKVQAGKARVNSYPTMKLYISGVEIEYKGKRKAEQIVEFIKSKVLPPATELKTVAEVKEKIGATGRRCILATNNKDLLKEYFVVARFFEYFTYYYTSEEVSKEVIPSVSAFPAVHLFFDFDEKQAVYTGEFNTQGLLAFLKTHQFPVVAPLNDESTEAIFQHADKKAMIFLHSGNNGDMKTKEAEFRKVAEKYNSEDLMFISGDAQTESGKSLLKHLGLAESDLPVVEIMEQTKGELKRYRHLKKINAKDLNEFFTKYVMGDIEKYVKTEEIPKVNEGPVYKVVGKNFKAEVIDNDMDVLVKFYAEWCGHCQKLAPLYKAVAEKLKNNKKLKLVEIDSTKNDIEGHRIEGLPTIKFFPGNNKNSPITFNGTRSEEGIISFLRLNCHTALELPEVKPDL